MTFSIVARSAAGDAWGVAVASKFLAVGAAVPAAQAGVGAIATQSFANLTYRPKGLALLAAGRSAQETLEELTGADDEAEERQAGIVDAAGRSATFTGANCLDWAGGTATDDVAIQGNILTGPDVVEQMHRAWDGSDPEAPLGRRLLAALRAGDAAGGDRRGRQSAALLVVKEGAGYGGFGDVQADLRVDDHPHPCAELERLLGLHDLFFQRPDEQDMVAIEGDVAAQIEADLARLGYQSLDEWVGAENYEMRVTAGAIDRSVLDTLHQQAAHRQPVE
jgi:uncharacterized Ntn-hydrolase superfamily protein